MHVGDDFGNPLDATAEIAGDAQCLRITLASRGGSRSSSGSARNTDYIPALLTLLRRLAALNAYLTDALVASRRTLHLSAEARRLNVPGYPFSIHLARAPVDDLAKRLRGAAAQIGREPGAIGSGNPTKRIELHAELPDHSGMSLASITVQLLNPAGRRTE